MFPTLKFHAKKNKKKIGIAVKKSCIYSPRCCCAEIRVTAQLSIKHISTIKLNKVISTACTKTSLPGLKYAIYFIYWYKQPLNVYTEKMEALRKVGQVCFRNLDY